MKPWFVFLLLVFPAISFSSASYTRVVDVGPGLCAITKSPEGNLFVYDAGHWNGEHCYEALVELAEGNVIELLILSHTDADHLGDAPKILNNFEVKNIVRTGSPKSRPTKTWKLTNEAIEREVADGAVEINLTREKLEHGKTFQLGSGQVTLLYGKGKWTGLSASENLNAVSIVAKYDYANKSILFTGDTVGKRLGDDDDACKDAEREMVDLHNAGNISLNATVIIAPHHGANNGSATCFIEAVSPEYVIFASGHDHGHPTYKTYQRYLQQGVDPKKIFRTDLNDAEADSASDWEDASLENCHDLAGDDDVEIILTDGSSNTPMVTYRDDGGVNLCRQ